VLSQWFFRITEFSERLLKNLEWIDWSESTKKAQENWIGRSDGAEIHFRTSARGSAHDIAVFTTRPDTVFGATFMVLAPEHPLVDSITTSAQQAEVEAYRARVRAMDMVARRSVEKAKTGIFTGAYCINPATDENIPVWIADYVLMDYGTGAIMAVPGHDERDFEFARTFGLDIRRVIAAEGEDATTPLAAALAGEGVLVNSGEFDGVRSELARSAVTTWLEGKNAGRMRVNYRLHDWCISRQRYWGPPIPIVYCDACGTVPVPEKDLPVVLPYTENYRPDESGISPLARVEEWYRVPCPACGKEGRRETDVSDTFLDSAWYFLRYPSANHHDVVFDAALTKKWLPVDIYIGGEEHAVLHLLYSRFITMVLHDRGFLEFEEPYRTFRKHGLLIKEGSKMSKSRGNVVIPDRYIEDWGADTFRTYLMFLGPYQEGGDFRDSGLQGPFGFLGRLWDTIVPAEELGDAPATGALEQKLHATIQKVTEDIAALRYNTAIAAMMEYLNAVREGGRAANRSEVESLVPLVAPFAPHIAEELWERLGHVSSLFEAPSWPDYDPAKAIADTIEMVVQVNGKVRARLPLARGVAQEAAQAAALADENVARFLDGTRVRKLIFVPDRLINLVVG
jgi:leucyl-tRNA synthetase